MSKPQQKPDLRKLLADKGGSTRIPRAVEPVATDVPTVPAERTRTGRPKTYPITVQYRTPEPHAALRLLAAQQRTTILNVMSEALNDLFAKHGMPEIAPRE